MLGNPDDTGDSAPNAPAQLVTVQPTHPAPLHDTASPPIQYVVRPPEQLVPLPALVPLPLVLPVSIELVIGRDGRYQQSDQIPEIQACLKVVVRRANANLALVDGFPDPLRKGEWLAATLISELGERRKGSINMAAVDDRAKHDRQYFNNLLLMVSRFVGVCRVAVTVEKSSQVGNRWSTFRQAIIDMVRTLIVSSESLYALYIPDDADPDEARAEQVTKARELHFRDAYHFGKTAAVSTCIVN